MPNDKTWTRGHVNQSFRDESPRPCAHRGPDRYAPSADPFGRPLAHRGGRRPTGRARRVSFIANALPGRTAPSSGAAMCWLDFARIRGAILAAPGEIGLRAVTTNLNINFLAKPKARDRIACDPFRGPCRNGCPRQPRVGVIRGRLS